MRDSFALRSKGSMGLLFFLFFLMRVPTLDQTDRNDCTFTNVCQFKAKYESRPNSFITLKFNLSIQFLHYELGDGQTQPHSILINLIGVRQFPKELKKFGFIFIFYTYASVFHFGDQVVKGLAYLNGNGTFEGKLDCIPNEVK